MLAPVFPYLEIAEEYEKAGASAISCLTEPKYFLGQDRYLQEIASKVDIPVLRKDFTVDSYQIYDKGFGRLSRTAYLQSFGGGNSACLCGTCTQSGVVGFGGGS